MKIALLSVILFTQSLAFNLHNDGSIIPVEGVQKRPIVVSKNIYIFDNKGNLLIKHPLNKVEDESVYDAEKLLDKSELIMEYSGSLYYMLGE